MIRPVVAALITRGHVQIDEISSLDCSQEEATALIPALTNVALAQRIARCSANTPKWMPDMIGYTVRALAQEAKLRLEAVPPGLPQYSNQELAEHIRMALAPDAEYPQPGGPDYVGYIDLLYVLSMQAAERLEGGF